MSLIYDALRALPAHEHTAQEYGSVCAGPSRDQRSTRWAWGMGAALVVVGGAALALASHDWRVVPAPNNVAAPAPAPRVVDAAPALTTPPAASTAALAIPSVAAPGAAPVRARIVEPVRVVAAPVAAPKALAQPRVALPAGVALTDAQTRPPEPAPAVAPEPAPAATEPARNNFGDSLRRFNALVARGEFDAAAQLLEVLRAQGLSRLALSRMAGYLALQANQLEEARRRYEQVLTQFPYDREAVLNLALIDLREGFFTAAEQRLRKFTETKPDDEQVRALLAQVRAQGGRR